jgi:glutathione S-transferase
MPFQSHDEYFAQQSANVRTRLKLIQKVVEAPFSIADIAMADVLRLEHRFNGLAQYPACQDYVARAVTRPAFMKAHADQLAHFALVDNSQASLSIGKR